MKILRVLPEEVPERYPADVTAMVDAYAEIGVRANRLALQAAWERYSDSMCAGWLILPHDPEAIRNCLAPYITIEESDELQSE